jgi:hypothetical protein
MDWRFWKKYNCIPIEIPALLDLTIQFLVNSGCPKGRGVILGFDVRRGGEDEPFKDVRRGEGGYFLFPPWGGGMDLFWKDPFYEISFKFS